MDEHHTPAKAPSESLSLDDRELDTRSIVIFGVVLFVGTLVVMVLMYWMSAAFKGMDEAKDPPPSPLVEAQLDPIPPGPRLQAVPPRDMDELRSRDRKTLTSYGWVDQAGGVAHIPVERAIAILATKGLPPTPATTISAVTDPAPASSAQTPEEAASASAAAAVQKPPKHKKKEKEKEPK
jgi:hypothetical protein